MEATDWQVEDKVAVFGSDFETILRDYFPRYAQLEELGREEGVSSKPFLARYVAERLPVDDAPGWAGMQSLAESIKSLLEA